MAGYEYVMNYLQREGFRFTDEGNHFHLKYQGGNYIIFKNDTMFVQIAMILNVEGAEYANCMVLANKLNSDKFVIKFTVNGEGEDMDVWCSYEFIPNEHTTGDDYVGILDYLASSTQTFFEELHQMEQ